MAEVVRGPLTEGEEESSGSSIVTGPLSEQEEAEGEEGVPGEQFKEPRLVESSMLAEVAWEPESETLEVVFVNGKSGSYPCDLATFEALLEAPSIGGFMHQNFL
jgi:hypothetical protein